MNTPSKEKAEFQQQIRGAVLAWVTSPAPLQPVILQQRGRCGSKNPKSRCLAATRISVSQEPLLRMFIPGFMIPGFIPSLQLGFISPVPLRAPQPLIPLCTPSLAQCRKQGKHGESKAKMGAFWERGKGAGVFMELSSLEQPAVPEQGSGSWEHMAGRGRQSRGTARAFTPPLAMVWAWRNPCQVPSEPRERGTEQQHLHRV